MAARLGVPVALAKASQREAREAQEAAVRQQLPPELAQKQASRSGWVAPDPESWVLQAYQPAGSSSSGDASLHASLHAAAASPGPSPSPVAAALFVDVTAKGRLLSAQEASGAFPELAGLGELVSRSGDVGPSAVSAAQPPGLPLDASGRHVIGVWAELARTMVEAHQRRGESDMVAHWLYQLMALDPSAREWRHMLSAASAGIALKQQ